MENTDSYRVRFDSDTINVEEQQESPRDVEDFYKSFNRPITEQSQNPIEQNTEMWQLNLGEARVSEDRAPMDPLMRQKWSDATLQVLSSMPSRTIGRSHGAIISQYYNRTIQMCRHKHSRRPSVHAFSHSARPSICGYGFETESSILDREEVKKAQLVINLQNLSLSDQLRMLKAIPLSLEEKKELKRLVSIKAGSVSDTDKDLYCSHLKNRVFTAFRNYWNSLRYVLSSLSLWQTALKRVSGRYGTGVLSYFVFLRTLLFFNIFLFLMMVLFLVLPQAVWPPTPTQSRNASYGLELLTGVGYFDESLMYYGYYSNYTLNACSSVENQSSCAYQTSYNMPLAYFFTIGMTFFITCIILVYSMSKSFGRSYRIDRSKSLLAMKVFCSWDFKVSQRSSVMVQSENISTQLKELVAEVNRTKEEVTGIHRVFMLSVQLLAWATCISSIVISSCVLYYFSQIMHKDLKNLTSPKPIENYLKREARLLALPMVSSSINLFVPGLFNVVAWMEENNSLTTRYYISIFRNLLLKVSLLGVMCYHWMGRIAPQNLPCWESFVGQEIYRFLVMDFIFSTLDTCVGDILRRVVTQKVLKKNRKPVFDIARNVLDLIYGQTLAWLGVLFSPLLPAIQVLKLVLLFYSKEKSLPMNCQTSKRPWRASQMNTFFLSLLCFPAFLGAAVCITYTIWMVKPSTSCGPFRDLNTMFESSKRWVLDLAKTNHNLSWLVVVHTYLVENPVCLFLAASIFLIVIYFHSQVLDGQRKVIELLQEQIENEGEDKKFLIIKLQDIHEQGRLRS